VSEILKVVLTPPGNDTAVDGAWSNNSTLLLATVSDDPAANCSQSSINLETADVDFKALQYAMLVTILVEVIGGVFFLLTACYIVEDKASVDRAIAGTQENATSVNSSAVAQSSSSSAADAADAPATYDNPALIA